MFTNFLIDHADKKAVSFHMPGHKGKHLYQKYGYGDFLDKFLECDITEIPGADNLFQTEGIIKDVQERYAHLYNVDNSYLLINGTSGGLIASILATVPRGKKIIMARNCHKSVFNGLILAGIEPIYAYPESYGEIAGEINPGEIETLLKENKDAEAVILPSPNYYGICSDIEEISRVTHEAGKVLIVDQAHGAHLKFFHKYGFSKSMPKAAEDLGADIVVNSIHKTLASMTQSAILNLKSERVDRYILEDKLQAIQSTSPSYILMASLDINAELLENHGKELIGSWRRSLDEFYTLAEDIPGLRVLSSKNMDMTKVNMDMSAYGIWGSELEEMLIKKNIYTELYTGNILMAMTGIGNTNNDMLKLANELRAIGRIAGLSEKKCVETVNSISMPKEGKLHKIPRYSEYAKLESVQGRICAASVIPYPPGIPLVCPGEEFSKEHIDFIRALRAAKEKVIGVNDRGEVLVGK